jgi:hypothetical protein
VPYVGDELNDSFHWKTDDEGVAILVHPAPFPWYHVQTALLVKFIAKSVDEGAESAVMPPSKHIWIKSPVSFVLSIVSMRR